MNFKRNVRVITPGEIVSVRVGGDGLYRTRIARYIARVWPGDDVADICPEALAPGVLRVHQRRHRHVVQRLDRKGPSVVADCQTLQDLPIDMKVKTRILDLHRKGWAAETIADYLRAVADPKLTPHIVKVLLMSLGSTEREFLGWEMWYV